MGEFERIPCEKYEKDCEIRHRTDGHDCGGAIYCKKNFGDGNYFCIDGEKHGHFGCRETITLNQRSELIEKLRTLPI